MPFGQPWVTSGRTARRGTVVALRRAAGVNARSIGRLAAGLTAGGYEAVLIGTANLPRMRRRLLGSAWVTYANVICNAEKCLAAAWRTTSRGFGVRSLPAAPR